MWPSADIYLIQSSLQRVDQKFRQLYFDNSTRAQIRSELPRKNLRAGRPLVLLMIAAHLLPSNICYSTICGNDGYLSRCDTRKKERSSATVRRFRIDRGWTQ